MMRRIRDEQGLSLSELVVYIGLLAIVTIIAGSVFSTYFQGEKAVQDVTSATNRGQIITTSLSNGIRSAATIQVLPVAGDDSQFITAKVGSADSTSTTWQCEAWYFSGSGEVYHRTSSTAIAIPDGDLTGWTFLTSGLLIPQTFVSPVVSLPVGSSVELSINFEVFVDGDFDAVKFSTKVANRGQNPGDALTCF